MPEWVPIFALPNINLQNPAEVEGVAIASVFDPRIVALANTYPNLKAFIEQFATEFSRPVSPSFIMVRDDMPDSYRRVDALASFRDALAIATTTRTWAKIFRYGRGGMYGPQYANSFSFYPWTLDKNYEGITTRSMALLGYENDLSIMSPQSTPGISPARLVDDNIDQPLLVALLSRWQRRYSGKSPSWKDRKLFRSLNMANAAASLPAHAEITNPDIGRHTALWVSAFEILAHPKTSDANLSRVYDMIEAARWNSSHHTAPIYSSYQGRRNRSPRILPSWIYGELYHARNDYLHGNPVRETRLTTRRSKRGLFFYASPLYRMALTSFLDLRWKQKKPPVKNIAALLKYRDEQSDFEGPQRDIETGLGSIKFTTEESEAIRNGTLKATVVRRPY